MEEEKQSSVNVSNNLLDRKFSHGYSVPGDYFESLPASIQEKLNRRETRTLAVPALFSSWKPAYTAITLLLAIIGISGFLFIMLNDRNDHFAGLNESMQQDLISLYSGIDPYFIYDIILESGLTVDELEFGLNGDHITEIENLTDYYFLDISSELFWQDTLLINGYDQ